ncbi:MAG: uroporphyrinogen-III C-methyltransferase [Sphingomonadales bacterium]
MPNMIAPGEVWLVGAGPGDPDLLTRKAEQLIRAATVIFYDALIGPGILDLVPRSVRLVPVGKRAGCHSKAQNQIDALLVEAALAGECVVRLKGGDPSVFGRSTEELAALAAVGIRAQICPGVTAASAAAAGAGLSLTSRGLARQVCFVTARTGNNTEDSCDWASLADPDVTLIFYMGRSRAADIRRNLLAYGRAPDTPVLIASNVSLPDARYVHTRLDLLPVAVDATDGGAPAIVMVGRAVLAPSFGSAVKHMAFTDG